MPESGPHAVFIWLAYAAAFVVFAALTLQAVLSSRVQKRALRRLQGGTSDASPGHATKIPFA